MEPLGGNGSFLLLRASQFEDGSPLENTRGRWHRIRRAGVDACMSGLQDGYSLTRADGTGPAGRLTEAPLSGLEIRPWNRRSEAVFDRHWQNLSGNREGLDIGRASTRMLSS